MLDLINLNSQKTMTSREISEIVRKQHKNVLADIRDETSKLGIERAELIFQPSEYKDTNNQSRPMYLLTLDGVLQLGARYSADVRYKLIQIAKDKLQKKEYTTKELLLMQLESIEKIEKLELENKEQKEQLEIQAPKVSYYDVVLNSPNLVTVTQIAKDYGKSGKWLNKLLSELKIQYKQSNQWLLYSKYQGKGYTQSVTYADEDSEFTKLNTKWTQKGRMFIYEKLKELNILPVVEREEDNYDE